MASIFTLINDASLLSGANEQTSRMIYEQHAPTRDVTGNNFSNGAIHWRWNVSGQKWWVPSRTYMRLRLRLSKVAVGGAAPLPLTLSDNIAPNMGLCANLFQNGEYRLADKTVSRISDYMPQVDALETRLSKSKSHLDSIGKSANWWDHKFANRQADVCSDGYLALESTDPAPVANSITSREGLGFVPVGGANAQTVGYTSATGIVVFAPVGGVAVPDVTVAFPIGSYIRLVAGAPEDQNGAAAKVIATTATTLTVDPASLGADIAVANNIDFERLTAIVAPPGQNDARNVALFEMIWQPPLSIFKIGHAIPSSKNELVLNPQTSSEFKKRAIESILGDKVAGVDFDISVEDMYLYVATVEGARADDLTYLLDLEETRCQVDVVRSSAFQQRNFDVSPSTYALTASFQDSRAGSITPLSASKFKVNGSRPITGDPSLELGLNRFFMSYAGQQRPAPDADPQYSTPDARDYTIQRYVESQIYSGAYYDCGGGETIQEWHERGPYYYFSWPKDGTDRSTRVAVHFGFENPLSAPPIGGGPIEQYGRVLLFDHSRKVGRIQVQDGRVIDVQVEDQ